MIIKDSIVPFELFNSIFSQHKSIELTIKSAASEKNRAVRQGSYGFLPFSKTSCANTSPPPLIIPKINNPILNFY